MPALAVRLNGESLVCVATDGLDVLDVGVSGDLLGPDPAILRIDGGSYPQGGGSQSVIWENERTLRPGDTVSVSFLAGAATSRPGSTIEQLYPNEAHTPNQPFPPPDQVVRELKQRPKAFHSLAFEFDGPDGRVQARTTGEDHGYAFTVLWNSHRPERARASAHTYTLDSLVTKERGTYHAETRLAFGQSVTLKVLAPNSTADLDARKSGARGSL